MAFLLAAIFALVPWLVSRRFAPRFKGRQLVIMQWSFSGKPTSWAPRRVALAFAPSVGTLSLMLVAASIAFAPPEGDRLPAMALIPLTGLLIAGIHAVHLHFAARAEER